MLGDGRVLLLCRGPMKCQTISSRPKGGDLIHTFLRSSRRRPLASRGRLGDATRQPGLAHRQRPTAAGAAWLPTRGVGDALPDDCRLVAMSLIYRPGIQASSAQVPSRALRTSSHGHHELLAFGVKNKASDLAPLLGPAADDPVHGDVRRINLPPMERDVHAMVYDIMNDASARPTRKTWVRLLLRNPQPGALSGQCLQPPRAPAPCSGPFPQGSDLEDLNCAEDLQDISPSRAASCGHRPDRLGKSTTLAAMVDHINENDYGHILTVEDPIEFVHESKSA